MRYTIGLLLLGALLAVADTVLLHALHQDHNVWLLEGLIFGESVILAAGISVEREAAP